MKKIKGLVVALLGALMLGIAAIPASAQGWSRDRGLSPGNRYDTYNSRNYYRRDRDNRDRDNRNRDNSGWNNRGWNNMDRGYGDQNDYFRNNGRRYQTYSYRSGRDNQRNRSYRRH